MLFRSNKSEFKLGISIVRGYTFGLGVITASVGVGSLVSVCMGPGVCLELFFIQPDTISAMHTQNISNDLYQVLMP